MMFKCYKCKKKKKTQEKTYLVCQNFVRFPEIAMTIN